MDASATNVVALFPKEAMARHLRAVFTRWAKASEDWINTSLELMQTLKQARELFPTNQAFGAWLGAEGLDELSCHDRAALINMAQDLELARIALQESGWTSYRRIWTEWMEPRLSKVGKTVPVVAESEKPAEPVAGPPPSKIEPSTKSALVSERGDLTALVHEYFRHCGTRALMKRLLNEKKYGAQILKWLRWSIEQGFLQPGAGIATEKPTFRLLMPLGPSHYSHQWNLNKPAHRDTIATRVIPALTERREELLAKPEAIERIVQDHWRQQDTAVRVAQAKQFMAAEQEAIVMFGQPLWPDVNGGGVKYDYPTICTAVWTLRDMLAFFKEEKAMSRAIQIRLLMKWYRKYLELTESADIKKVFGMLDRLAGLLEQQPDGECKYPTSPKRDDEWIR